MRICLVSDSATPMVKMRDILKERRVVHHALGCSLHKIQNAITDANKSTKGATQTKMKATRISKHIT